MVTGGSGPPTCSQISPSGWFEGLQHGTVAAGVTVWF